jgi:hypothetical protein
LGAEISEGKGSRLRIALNNVRAVFHRPHPHKETDKGALRSLRRDAVLGVIGLNPTTALLFANPSDRLQVVVRQEWRSHMVARGHVQNGVVVLADGVRLPEGQEVTVLAGPSADTKRHGVLDIPPVSLGSLVRSFSAAEDLLDEMLEGRS